MPKFTQEELEEIRRNTEEVEKARRGKKNGKGEKDGAVAKKGKSSKKRSSKKEVEVFSLKDRMVALVLLAISVLISVIVWQLYGS